MKYSPWAFTHDAVVLVRPWCLWRRRKLVAIETIRGQCFTVSTASCQVDHVELVIVIKLNEMFWLSKSRSFPENGISYGILEQHRIKLGSNYNHLLQNNLHDTVHVPGWRQHFTLWVVERLYDTILCCVCFQAWIQQWWWLTGKIRSHLKKNNL